MDDNKPQVDNSGMALLYVLCGLLLAVIMFIALANGNTAKDKEDKPTDNSSAIPTPDADPTAPTARTGVLTGYTYLPDDEPNVFTLSGVYVQEDGREIAEIFEIDASENMRTGEDTCIHIPAPGDPESLRISATENTVEFYLPYDKKSGMHRTCWNSEEANSEKYKFTILSSSAN